MCRRYRAAGGVRGDVRFKGDQGPDAGQPQAKAYWCTYATVWPNVKSTHQLTFTEAQKTKLTDMLEACS